MNLSFIETFYADIDKWLVEADASARYPRIQRLRDLHSLDAQLFEKLLHAAGPESLMGYAEALLAFESQKMFYPLPQGFRQLLSVERRRDPSSTTITSVPLDRILNRLRSKTFYDEKSGVTILTGNRGIRVDPLPTEASEWVLVYLRGVGQLHYAMASSVSDFSLTTGTPPDDAGRVILQNDYYTGMEIQVYDARVGAPQIREVTQFRVTEEDKGVFHIRHPWTPRPEGDIWYEVRPAAPPEYDEIYGLDAALRILTLRGLPEIANQLLKYRERTWQACRAYFESNVMDRGPSRLRPLKPEDRMPTGGAPVV